MMPIGGNSDCGIVEAGSRGGIERPGQPVARKNGAESDPLIAYRTKGQQEQEGIAQADLRERVFKGEVGLAAVERAKENAQRNQEQRSPDCVGEHLGKLLALPLAASDRIRKRYADQEREGGLDHIVQRTTEPLSVGLVEGKNLPENAVVEVCRDFGELED